MTPFLSNDSILIYIFLYIYIYLYIFIYFFILYIENYVIMTFPANNILLIYIMIQSISIFAHGR